MQSYSSKVNALKETGSNDLHSSHMPSQHHGDTKYTYEMSVSRGKKRTTTGLYESMDL